MKFDYISTVYDSGIHTVDSYRFHVLNKTSVMPSGNTVYEFYDTSGTQKNALWAPSSTAINFGGEIIVQSPSPYKDNDYWLSNSSDLDDAASFIGGAFDEYILVEDAQKED